MTLSTTNSSAWSSNVICRKLLWFWYYNARCFGMVAFGIKQCKEVNDKIEIGKTLLEISIKSQPNSTPNPQLSQWKRYVLPAYVLKSMIWLHILIRIILCISLTYGILQFQPKDNNLLANLILSQVATVVVCPILMVIIEIWHRKRLLRAINDLFRLLQAIQEFNGGYEIFQWTHVSFVALKVVVFLFENIVYLVSVIRSKSRFEAALKVIQSVLLTEVWLNIHAATLLYVCVEAMYGSLNHYIRHKFISRQRAIQIFGPISSSKQVTQLTADLAKFMGLYKKVRRVGLELHYLWQIPVAITLVSMYTGMLTLIYITIWHYFKEDIINMSYIPLQVKLMIDILLVSLTAHRAIKSSQLIGCMGLENVVLAENEEWQRQMEQFLYHINLYEFKLNFMGLFDITNALTLTFISGLLTSINIFVTFSIETYRIERFLKNQN